MERRDCISWLRRAHSGSKPHQRHQSRERTCGSLQGSITTTILFSSDVSLMNLALSLGSSLRRASGVFQGRVWIRDHRSRGHPSCRMHSVGEWQEWQGRGRCGGSGWSGPRLYSSSC